MKNPSMSVQGSHAVPHHKSFRLSNANTCSMKARRQKLQKDFLQ